VGVQIAILTLVLVGLVVLVVGAPLRRARRVAGSASGAGRSLPEDAPALSPASERDELEAAREAKYREIRDAELDFRTGKLSREDYEAIDADLRAEAIEILNRLERLS
jgi:biopolymer transport protein ExbB/TolQ